MAGKARDVKPTGSEGFAASSSLVAQVGGLSVPSDAKPLTINAVGQQFAVAVRVPGRPARRPGLLLQRARRPRGHGGRPPRHCHDVIHRWFIPGPRRPGGRGPRRHGGHLVPRRSRGRLPGAVDLLLGYLLLGDARLGARGQPRRLPAVRPAEAERPRRGPEVRAAEGHPERRSRGSARDPADRRRAAPPRGRHGGDPAPPAGLGRASDERQPQVGRGAVHRHLALLPGPGGGRVRAHAGCS